MGVSLLPLMLAGAAQTQGRTKVDVPGAERFPNVELLNQDGKTLRFYSDVVRGDHTVVINFIYAQCGDICPMTMTQLSRVQALLGERLGREVRIASITIDPVRDSPVVLKAYAKQFDARPGWQFLTGWPDDIERIRRQLGAFDRDPEIDKDKTQHAGMLVYGNQARGRWGRVSGLAQPQQIYTSITRWV